MTRSDLGMHNLTGTRKKANTPKRCRGCGATVRWCEKANGWHVKLDWYPSSTGRWRIHESGVAHEMPGHHEGGWAMYDRHVCPEVKP